jgi:hypothetical protein
LTEATNEDCAEFLEDLKNFVDEWAHETLDVIIQKLRTE